MRAGRGRGQVKKIPAAAGLLSRARNRRHIALHEQPIYVTRAASQRQIEGERWRLLVHLIRMLDPLMAALGIFWLLLTVIDLTGHLSPALRLLATNGGRTPAVRRARAVRIRDVWLRHGNRRIVLRCARCRAGQRAGGGASECRGARTPDLRICLTRLMRSSSPPHDIRS
jgi:hypothetical protein